MGNIEPLLKIETFPVGTLGCNCSLIYSPTTKEAIVVDPGNDVMQLLAKVQNLGLQVKALLHTHAHFHHIGQSSKAKMVLGAPILLHPDDAFLYKDFAHSPSKLKATTSALKKQFPNRQLVACMELHTFSSLNKKFLKQYDGSMKEADLAIIYYSPKTIKHKKLEAISKNEVIAAFNSSNIEVITDSSNLLEKLNGISWKNKNLLLMSSGNFGGLDFNKIL